MSNDIMQDAKAELSGMAKQGMRHPSTKPVLVGAAAGAVAGVLLPLLSPVAGLVIGAGAMFYKRLRP
ncbi:hypothetical protein [Novosphingobium sp.]|uniref:hypothetical protein n=1 Tax=Novosphingobium sp. TaxID=1874826 RepID=UPI0025D7CE9B|nr:hypothetical protein [Novosphingobium sp.]MCC6925870.1 hypothetical protein [Novosphingobium sp.]